MLKCSNLFHFCKISWVKTLHVYLKYFKNYRNNKFTFCIVILFDKMFWTHRHRTTMNQKRHSRVDNFYIRSVVRFPLNDTRSTKSDLKKQRKYVTVSSFDYIQRSLIHSCCVTQTSTYLVTSLHMSNIFSEAFHFSLGFSSSSPKALFKDT